MASNSNNNGATNVVLNLQVNGQQQLQQAATSVSNLSSGVQTLNNTPVNGDGFKNYRQQIREARSELERIEQQSGKNSAAFLRQAQVLAELKDRQAELNDTVKAFDVDNKFAAFGKTASSATGVLAGFSGGLIALGFNSEKSAENLARLQGLLAFSHSLSQLDDLKNSFGDLGRVIQASILPKVADAAAIAAQTTALAANDAAQQALTVATGERLVAEQALNTVQANTLATTVEITAAQNAYNAALAEEATLTAAATVTQTALDAATAATTVSTGAAAIATNVLGFALKALGIGLILSAIAALVTQWDNLTASVSKLFPEVKNSTSVFHEFMEVVNGVGLVVLKYLKAPIDYAITSFKILIDLIKLDFKAAAADFKEGVNSIADDLNVINNYKKGAADKAAEYADEARKVEIQKTIDDNDRRLKLLKAAGKDTTDLQIATEKLKLSILDKSDKDYQKKYQDGQNTILIIQAEHNKKLQDARDKAAKERAEKAKAEIKTDIDNIKKANEENLKVINEGSEDARGKELADIDTKYKAEFALLEKRKKDNINYNKDFNDAVTARKLQEARINRKYDDQIADYLKGIQNENISTYDKAINEINAKVDAQLKNATPEEADALEAARQDQINKQRGLKIASGAATDAAANAKQVNAKNKADDKDGGDVASQKVGNNQNADTDAENKAFEAKLLTLEGQNDAIAALQQEHEAKLTDIANDAAKQRRDIDEKAFEAKKAIQTSELDLVGNIGSVIEQAAGKNKALAIAGVLAEQAAGIGKIVINTQVANAKAVSASPLTFGQPWVTINTLSGVLAGAASIAAGVKAVQQINSGTADGGISAAASSIGGGGASSAPVINSTVLQQQNSGTQDIVNAVKTDKSQPIKAYVTLKDLQTAQAKDNLNKSLSIY